MNRLARVVVPLAVALALGGRACAADLLVEWGNPNAYQTLQAALDAAQPGDRILIKGWLQIGVVHVTKSVTIESFDQSVQEIGVVFEMAPNPHAGFIIEQLTEGLPFVLRRLSFFAVYGRPYVFAP